MVNDKECNMVRTVSFFSRSLCDADVYKHYHILEFITKQKCSMNIRCRRIGFHNIGKLITLPIKGLEKRHEKQKQMEILRLFSAYDIPLNSKCFDSFKFAYHTNVISSVWEHNSGVRL